MATLQKVGDKAQCPVNLSKMRIGRETDNEIIVEDDAVSGHHALITISEPQTDDDLKLYFVEDLGSTNHTYVNEKQITKQQQLNDGDIIRIGYTKLKFSTGEYVPPKVDFQKTQQISNKRWTNFFIRK